MANSSIAQLINNEKPAPRLSLEGQIAALDEADRAAVESAIGDPTWPIPDLHATLAKAGINTSERTLYRARKRRSA